MSIKSSEQNPAVQQLLDHAQSAFKKMPALGPIAWLWGRMPGKQTFFLQDLDWAVLPPLILDQCRLFMNGEMPFGYISWAFINDDAHARLLTGNTKLQPHEWHGGSHVWLVDLVMPFGQTEEMLTELKRTQFTEQSVSYIGLDEQGLPVVKSL